MQNEKAGSRERILTGPILSTMLVFAFPIIMTSVLQQLYNTADTLIVGIVGGKEALSAVGASGSIISLCINVFVSIFTGTNILVARHTGDKDDDAIRRVVSTTYLLSIAMGAAIMIFGLFNARALLEYTECPPEILDEATKYLTIYFLAVPGSMIVNFGASVIRSSGDSRTPFIFLSVSGALNVLFNVIFVIIFGNPVTSVAVATALSIYVDAALFIIYLLRADGAKRLYPFKLKFDGAIFVKTIRYGIPSAIATACFAITNFIIQPAINAFGTDGISGMSAAASIESYVFLVGGAVGTTVCTFMGQNIGAGNRERVKLILKRAYVMNCSVILTLSLLTLLVAKPLLGLFIPGETAAIEFGYLRLKLCLGAAVMQGVMNVNNGALQAYGYTSILMVSNLIGVCLFRILWMTYVYPLDRSPLNFLVCYPVSWTFSAAAMFTIVMLLTRKYMRSGRIKI